MYVVNSYIYTFTIMKIGDLMLILDRSGAELVIEKMKMKRIWERKNEQVVTLKSSTKQRM